MKLPTSRIPMLSSQESGYKGTNGTNLASSLPDSLPSYNIPHRYDGVMLDEAQDCSPVIAAVVMAQSCARIIVGDPHQVGSFVTDKGIPSVCR